MRQEALNPPAQAQLQARTEALLQESRDPSRHI